MRFWDLRAPWLEPLSGPKGSSFFGSFGQGSTGIQSILLVE